MADQVIENMAEICHEEWMTWSKDVSKDLNLAVEMLKNDIELLKEKGIENKEAFELVQKLESRLERWQALWIPYDELSEEMKDADRVYAEKMFNVAKESF